KSAMSKPSPQNIPPSPPICARFPGSACVSRAGDRVSRSRTFLDAGRANFQIFSKDCFGATPKPARKTHALPHKTRLERCADDELTRAVVKAKRAGQLTLLGRSEARIPTSPTDARLETFPNPAPNRNYR